MPRAVRLEKFGGVDNLQVVEVSKPTPGAGEIVVRVLAAGINPGEIKIREGLMQQVFPWTLPSGQGTDFAGIVDAVASGVSEFAAGDEVVGWSEKRSSQADYVLTEPTQLIRKPQALDWIRGGSLFVVATTAFAAVRSVELKPGDVVAISNAVGGVGSFAVQLARRTGARVLGIAGPQSADLLRSLGVEPIAYGDGLAARLRATAPHGINAFIDLYGDEYVELAVELGVPRQRIDSIAGFAAAAKYGIKTEGSSAAGNRETLAQMADLVAFGELLMPIAAIYPLDQVRDAYVELARGKTHGKIVLTMDPRRRKPERS